MIKIPPSLGDQNINLTMDYLQEEEDPTQFLGEEERITGCFYQFRIFISDPLSKQF